MRASRFRLGVVLLGALSVAAIDLAFAILFWLGRDVPPIQILQSIAAGLLGRDSYAGGAGTAVLGAVLHVSIAIAMGATYALAARRAPALVRHPIGFGLAYGVALYLVMNLVVLPLSAVGIPSFANHAWVASSVAMHALFGVIFALAAKIALG